MALFLGLVRFDHCLQLDVRHAAPLLFIDALSTFIVPGTDIPADSGTAIKGKLHPQPFSVMVFMNSFCRHNEGLPGRFVLRVSVGNLNPHILRSILAGEGLCQPFAELDRDFAFLTVLIRGVLHFRHTLFLSAMCSLCSLSRLQTNTDTLMI